MLESLAASGRPAATVPPPGRRRWLQFSLRSLLVLVTLLALGLGWFVRRVEPQRRAVAKVQSLGGSCHFDSPLENSGAVRRFLRRGLGPAFVDPVVDVDLSYSRAVDGDLACLQTVPGLKSLDLYATQVTDTGLARLQHLHDLESLNLGRTRITDAGLAALAELQALELLSLGGCPITDAGLECLAKFPRLRYLYLSHSMVSDDGLAAFQEALPNCQVQTPSGPRGSILKKPGQPIELLDSTLEPSRPADFDALDISP